jgi:biopolymer transport protein ExbB
MWALFIKGGPVMFPLALLSILGVAVVIEKLYSLRNRKVLTQEIINCIESLRSTSDIPMAIKLCERHSGPLAHIIRAGLEEASSRIPDVRLVMEDTGRREIKRLERYLVVLETVAAASPLLGLLGTVLGMIKVFSVISIAGVGEAGLLSGGIAEALITTAFGLSIGIPALIAFNFFDSRVENFVIKIEGNVHLLLKQLSAMKQVKQGSTTDIREISDAAPK